VVELANEIAKRWDILQELHCSGETHVTGLAAKLVRNMSNVARDLQRLEETGLVIFREEPKPEGGRPYKYYRLTEMGDKLVTFFIEVTRRKPEEPVKLEEADSTLVSFLIEKIQKSSFLETKKHAMEDFKDLCYHRAIIRHKDARDLIKELIQTEDGLRWGVDCLTNILNNSEKVNDQEALKIFKDEFFEPLEYIANKPIEKNVNSRLEAMKMMRRFLSADEWFEKLKGIIEKAVKEEEDKTYLSFRDGIIRSLDDFIKGKEREAWMWLYDLLENENETVKERSAKLLTGLRFEKIL